MSLRKLFRTVSHSPVVRVGALLLAFASLVPADNAMGAVSYTGASPQEGYVDFQASVASTMTLTIEGEEGTVGSGADASACTGTQTGVGTTTMTNGGLGIDAPAINDVVFGNVNSTCTAVPTTGACCVVDAANARLVATLTARITFSGYASASLVTCHDQAAEGVTTFGTVLANTGVATDWSAAVPAGWTVENVVGTCTNVNYILNAVASGTSQIHQFAFPIASTTTGTRNARIRYRATGV